MISIKNNKERECWKTDIQRDKQHDEQGHGKKGNDGDVIF